MAQNDYEHVVGMSSEAIASLKECIRCHGRSYNGGPRTISSKSSLDNKMMKYWMEGDVLMSSHPTKGVRRVAPVDDILLNGEMRGKSAKAMLLNCLVRLLKVPVPIAMAVATGPAYPICIELDDKLASGAITWEEFKEQLSVLTFTSLQVIAEKSGKDL